MSAHRKAPAQLVGRLHIGSQDSSAFARFPFAPDEYREGEGAGSFNRKARRRSKLLSGYTDVDRSRDPRSFVRHLCYANGLPDLQVAKGLLRSLLSPQAGDCILDVGCGLGYDSQALAQIVGKLGSVVGLDSSTTMIREARRRTRRSPVPPDFRVGDAHRLDFPDGAFDSCFVASTLMHVERPAGVLAEMVRVLKPGGRIVALECDWETLVISAENPLLEKKLVALLSRSIRNASIGHQLPVLFKKLHLQEIGVGAGTLTVVDYEFADQTWRIQENMTQAVRAGALSASETRNLAKDLRAASDAGRFFGAATSFAVSGTKPSRP